MFSVSYSEKSSFQRMMLSALVLFGGATLGACGLTKNLDEMHAATDDVRDTTQDMNKTTRQMSETTGKMQQTTEELKRLTEQVLATTCEVRDVQVHGGSEQVRDTKFENVRKEKVFTGKLGEAGIFFKGMEFQLWRSTCKASVEDAFKDRQSKIDEGVSSFLLKLEALIEEGEITEENLTPFKLPSLLGAGELVAQAAGLTGAGSETMESFLALAAASNQVSRKQEEMKVILEAAKVPFEIVTVYTELVKGLKQKKEVEEGRIPYANLTLSAIQTLNHEGASRLFLQARQNMLATMALSNVSHLKEPSSFIDMHRGPTLGKVFGVELGFKQADHWILDMNGRNIAQINESLRYLNAALGTIDSLNAVGVQPSYNQDLVIIWQRAKLSEDLTTVQAKVAAAKAKALQANPAQSDFSTLPGLSPLDIAKANLVDLIGVYRNRISPSVKPIVP